MIIIEKSTWVEIEDYQIYFNGSSVTVSKDGKSQPYEVLGDVKELIESKISHDYVGFSAFCYSRYVLPNGFYRFAVQPDNKYLVRVERNLVKLAIIENRSIIIEDPDPIKDALFDALFKKEEVLYTEGHSARAGIIRSNGENDLIKTIGYSSGWEPVVISND